MNNCQKYPNKTKLQKIKHNHNNSNNNNNPEYWHVFFNEAFLNFYFILYADVLPAEATCNFSKNKETLCSAKNGNMSAIVIEHLWYKSTHLIHIR